MDLKENGLTPKRIKVEESKLERKVKVKAVFDSFCSFLSSEFEVSNKKAPFLHTISQRGDFKSLVSVI